MSDRCAWCREPYQYGHRRRHTLLSYLCPACIAVLLSDAPIAPRIRS